MTRKPTLYIRTTIAEAFPVLYGHVNQTGHTPESAVGPFYRPGESFLNPYDHKGMLAAQANARVLHSRGWSVAVDLVERSPMGAMRVVETEVAA